MDGSASIGLEQALLGHSLGFAPFASPTQVYVALCLASTVPSETVPGLEASGGGYARMPATFALIAGPSNIAANTTSIEFPQALSSWGQIGFFELWDAPSGGNRLYWGQLVSTTDFTTPLVLQVSAGDITRFSAGTLGVQASTGAGGTASIGAYLPLAGGQMGGPLLLSHDPTALTEAATKSYVDAHSGTGGGPGFLALSGGTMLGQLILAADATLPLQPASLQQLNAAVAGGPFLALTGGTVTGPTTFSGSQTNFTNLIQTPQINTSGGATLVMPQVAQVRGLSFWPPAGGITFSGATGTPFLNLGMNLAGSLSSATGFLSANLFTFSADYVQVPTSPAANSFSWLGLNGNVGLAPWLPSHAYALNATAASGGRIYTVTTAGTSASSGGPTGTGAGITDGTVVWSYTSPNATGDRSGLFSRLLVQSTPGDVVQGRTIGPAYVGVGGQSQSAVNMGGTNLAAGAAGGIYGANFLALLGAGATNIGSLIGTEIDISAVAGATVKNKVGLQIVQVVTDKVAGTADDVGLLFGAGNQQGSGPGWKIGLAFGSMNTAGFPINSTGTIVACNASGGTLNAATGIDFSNVTFSAFSLRLPAFTVDGAGHCAPLLTNAANDAAAAAANVPIGAMYRTGNAVQVRLV